MGNGRKCEFCPARMITDCSDFEMTTQQALVSLDASVPFPSDLCGFSVDPWLIFSASDQSRYSSGGQMGTGKPVFRFSLTSS